jgi:hypothetical protein
MLVLYYIVMAFSIIDSAVRVEKFAESAKPSSCPSGFELQSPRIFAIRSKLFFGWFRFDLIVMCVQVIAHTDDSWAEIRRWSVHLLQ